MTRAIQKRAAKRVARARRPRAARVEINPTERFDVGPSLMRFVPSELMLSQEEQVSLSVVWACIRILVDSLASLEWKVFTRDAQGRRIQAFDDQVAWMFNVRPNPDMTAQALKEMFLTQMLVDGAGFDLITHDGAGRPGRIDPLDAPSMLMLRNRGTGQVLYSYSHPDTGEVTVLEPSEVLHFRGPCSSARHLMGDSTLYRAAKAVSLGVAQERYATSYYSNGADPGLLLKPPPTSTRRADPDSDERLRQEWKKRHGNARGKGHGLAVLEPGWDVVNLERDAQKSQVIPARQFSVEEIARYFGVPLVLLGVQAAAQGYGTNVSQLYQVFARNTLLPWTNRITEEAQFKLYPQRKPWREIEIDLSPLMRGDELQKAQADEIAVRTGKKTVNEVRADDGLNSIGPDGDVTLVASGLQPLERAIKPPEPPPAPRPPPGEEPDEDDDDMPMRPEDAARAAVALDRYARKLEARRKDLERHAPEKVEENLAAERARSLAALVTECGAALGPQVEAAAAAVEAGEPAHLAVLRLAQAA